MAKRKSAIVEQETLAQQAIAAEPGKGRPVRRQANAVAPAAKAASRRSASTVVPLPVKSLRTAPVPEHVQTVAELVQRYPTIAAFPGLATSSAAASSLPAHTSPLHTHGRLSVRQCLSELRDALAEGWEIVQPIFARPLWYVPDDSTTAFNFVLHRELATRLIVVPEGRTVERFIRDRNLTVDYRR